MWSSSQVVTVENISRDVDRQIRQQQIHKYYLERLGYHHFLEKLKALGDNVKIDPLMKKLSEEVGVPSEVIKKIPSVNNNAMINYHSNKNLTKYTNSNRTILPPPPTLPSSAVNNRNITSPSPPPTTTAAAVVESDLEAQIRANVEAVNRQYYGPVPVSPATTTTSPTSSTVPPPPCPDDVTEVTTNASVDNTNKNKTGTEPPRRSKRSRISQTIQTTPEEPRISKRSRISLLSRCRTGNNSNNSNTDDDDSDEIGIFDEPARTTRAMSLRARSPDASGGDDAHGVVDDGGVGVSSSSPQRRRRSKRSTRSSLSSSPVAVAEQQVNDLQANAQSLGRQGQQSAVPKSTSATATATATATAKAKATATATATATASAASAASASASAASASASSSSGASLPPPNRSRPSSSVSSQSKSTKSSPSTRSKSKSNSYLNSIIIEKTKPTGPPPKYQQSNMAEWGGEQLSKTPLKKYKDKTKQTTLFEHPSMPKRPVQTLSGPKKTTSERPKLGQSTMTPALTLVTSTKAAPQTPTTSTVTTRSTRSKAKATATTQTEPHAALSPTETNSSATKSTATRSKATASSKSKQLPSKAWKAKANTAKALHAQAVKETTAKKKAAKLAALKATADAQANATTRSASVRSRTLTAQSKSRATAKSKSKANLLPDQDEPEQDKRKITPEMRRQLEVTLSRLRLRSQSRLHASPPSKKKLRKLPDDLFKCLEPPFQAREDGKAFKGRSDRFDPDRLLQINQYLKLMVDDPKDQFLIPPNKPQIKGDLATDQPLCPKLATNQAHLDRLWKAKKDEKLEGNHSGQCNGDKKLFDQKEKDQEEKEKYILKHNGRKKDPASIHSHLACTPVSKLNPPNKQQKALLDICDDLKTFCEMLNSGEYGLHVNLQRLNWTKACQTNFHAVAYALMSAGTQDWSLMWCMGLLRAFGVLNVRWLTTAGTPKQRIAWLKKVMLYTGYNFHDRAAKLVGLAMFIKEKGGIPKDPLKILPVSGMGGKVTVLGYQELGVNVAPVVDTHVTAVCESLLGIIEEIESKSGNKPNDYEMRITNQLKQWMPHDKYKLFNEAICGFRMAYQGTDQKEKEKFEAALAQFFSTKKSKLRKLRLAKEILAATNLYKS